MLLHIANVLSSFEITSLLNWMQSDANWTDGQADAAWQERAVKHNEYALQDNPQWPAMSDLVTSALMRNSAFVTAARPKKIIGPNFIRYGKDRSFGNHVDNPLMGGVRIDLSLTIYLMGPESYEGGELIIQSGGEEKSVKLQAGHMILYPSTSLHRVEPVKNGTRLVVTAWVRSFIRDAAIRETLLDIDTARQSLFRQHGQSRDIDLIAQSLANLIRHWAED